MDVKWGGRCGQMEQNRVDVLGVAALFLLVCLSVELKIDFHSCTDSQFNFDILDEFVLIFAHVHKQRFSLSSTATGHRPLCIVVVFIAVFL